jgi:hypothetical protein
MLLIKTSEVGKKVWNNPCKFSIIATILLTHRDIFFGKNVFVLHEIASKHGGFTPAEQKLLWGKPGLICNDDLKLV